MATRSSTRRRAPTRKAAAEGRSSTLRRRSGRAERAVASATKVRYAVVGLGHIAQVAILPAFAQAAQNSTLAALVSDDPEKLRKLSRRYGVRRACSYDCADELFESGEVDAVYITLPNSMHRLYTERAARAGLHVLCEKPMAVTSSDCQRMIDVTRENDVRLMIAYRLRFERGNLEAAEMAHSGTLGDLRFFSSNFSMQVAPENWRIAPPTRSWAPRAASRSARHPAPAARGRRALRDDVAKSLRKQLNQHRRPHPRAA